MDFTSKEREYLDTHPYKIEQLCNIAKDKPVLKLSISIFNKSLSSKFWDDKDGNDISPYEVLDNPEKAPYHIKVINNANLDYPIIVAKSNLDVLDGLHRLCKSILLKNKYIHVQKINITDLEKSIGGIKLSNKLKNKSSKLLSKITECKTIRKISIKNNSKIVTNVRKMKRITKKNIKYSVNDIKNDTNKVVKMYLNIKKFKHFYKNLTASERKIIDFYKRWGYQNMNRFLYSGYKLETLFFPDYMGFFQEDQRKYIPKYLQKFMNYKTKKFIPKYIPEFITLFMNNEIINRVYEMDKLYTKPDTPKFEGTEILYRGTNGAIVTDKNTKIGDELIFKNYTSTSSNKKVALSFSNLKTSDDNHSCCLFILYNMKNIPYIYLPWDDVYKHKNINNSDIKYADDDEFEYLLPRNLKFEIINITIGLPVNNTKSYANKKFKEINKTMKQIQMSHLEKNNLSNKDYKMIIPDLFKDIKVYHLKFIEQLEIEKFPEYVYNKDIEIINNSK